MNFMPDVPSYMYKYIYKYSTPHFLQRVFSYEKELGIAIWKKHVDHCGMSNFSYML